MLYNLHKSTGLKLSAIGFGGMRFTGLEDYDEGTKLVHAAYEAGINYFDTAIGYGTSEERFGIAFKEMLKTRKEKPFYVSSKSFAGDPEKLRSDIETSLTRMGLDYLDFYHVWCIKNTAAYNQRKKIIKEFEKLKEEGLIKHIAVSTHMTGTDIGEMLEDYDFESVLMGYSPMNFMYREVGLQSAADKGVGMVVMNPLGGGIIPQNPELFSFLKTVESDTVSQAALRFLMSDPRITVSLVGFSNMSELNEAIEVAETFEPLKEEQIDNMRSCLKDSFDALCTGCQYCKECPKGIGIPKLMDAYNVYKLSNKPEEAINRLRYHWDYNLESDLPIDCIECGACESACTQHLPIVERIKELNQIHADFMKQQA